MTGEKTQRSLEEYEAEIRSLLEKGALHSLLRFIEDEGIEDDAMIGKLHESYVRIGREIDLLKMTPEQISSQAQIAKEEADDIFG